MKRAKFVVGVILLCVTLSSCAPAAVKPAFLPHENPATAKSSFDTLASLISYGDILDLIASDKYQDADELIAQLGRADIPEEFKYIVGRYSELLSQLTISLRSLEEKLQQASLFLSQQRLNEARIELEETDRNITNARDILKSMEEATEELGARLGVPAAPAASRLRQVYDRLRAIVERLQELSVDYEKLAGGLKTERQRQVTEQEELKPTQITLKLTPGHAFVGESINVSGSLTSQKRSPLVSKEIALFLDEEMVVRAKTNISGKYSADIVIPWKYVGEMNVSAVYIPQGGDKEKYRAASVQGRIEVEFYVTSVEIVVPDRAYPGLPLIVSGNVTSEGGAPAEPRKVGLFLDGNLFLNGNLQAEVYALRDFELEMTLPPEEQTGEHILYVAVVPEGRYAGTFQSETLEVIRAMPQIEVQGPNRIILPGKVYVKGKASSDFGAISGARVTAGLGAAQDVVLTAEDGSFDIALDLPLDFSLVGHRNIDVEVKPTEPWYASAKTKVPVMVINGANLGLVILGLASAGIILLVTRRRKKKGRVTEGIEVVPTEVAAGTTPTVSAGVKRRGLVGKVVGAYFEAVRAVERMDGVRMTSQWTLREFLDVASPGLGSLGETFAELTDITEMALYSPRLPQRAEVARAKKLSMAMTHGLTDKSPGF